MKSIDGSKLEALAAALPGRIDVAERALLDAGRQLAQILILRAVGRPIKRSDLSSARMTLARTRRDLEDLRGIQAVLPALPANARKARQTESVAELT